MVKAADCSSRYAVSGQTFGRNENYNYSKASKTRKYGVGAASLIVPGLGQVINNETPKGIAFFLGAICDYLLLVRNSKPFGRLIGLGIAIWAAIDAYRHAR